MSATAKSAAVLAFVAFAAVEAANAQRLDRKVVIVGPPGEDSSVWKRISPPSPTIADLEELKKMFHPDKYLMIEQDDAWVFIFDRDHPTLRWRRAREPVFNAFLRLADENGALRFGDLSESEKESVLELFTSSAVAIRKMGEAANDVKIGLGARIWMEAEVDGRTVATRISLSQDPDERNRFMNDMSEHGVRPNRITKEEGERMVRRSWEVARKGLGLSFRYIGVQRRAQSTAIRSALDAFDQYLREQNKKLESTYDALADRLMSADIPEFGGELPHGALSRGRVPDRFWSGYAFAIRFNPGAYGLSGELDAEQFLNGVKSVRFKQSYYMYYLELPGLPVDGRPAPGVGHSVEILRR